MLDMLEDCLPCLPPIFVFPLTTGSTKKLRRPSKHVVWNRSNEN